MSVDDKRLRELAEAATPGPWHAEPFSRSGDKPPMWRGRVFLLGAENPKTNTRDCDLTIPDARFIAAANPATVLALLDRIASLSKEVERLNGERDEALRHIDDHWLTAELAKARLDCERLARERDEAVACAERLKMNAPETTSDGYHTFAELYDHRITLFLAFASEVDARTPTGYVWRSKLHSDGTMFDGWFVMGIGTHPGEQITYHLPLSRWGETDWLGTENERAPDFDGHTSADVLARIRGFYVTTKEHGHNGE